MKLFRFRAALRLSLLLALASVVQAASIDPAQQSAPADGFGAGTIGGAAALSSQIYSVSTRPQLLAALQRGAANPKIIRLSGTIDMTEGVPYANTGDQAIRGLIRLPSNTTLIGADGNAGIINGHIVVSNVTQIIIRNLKIVNPCDVGPVWDPSDGALGNWNSAYDGIGLSGADHVWVDHVTFTDGAMSDDLLPIENGQMKQCHDGALDITNASDYVTVSYNLFGQHRKNNLVGSSDTATADSGKLHVTFSNNVFRDIVSRAPRVRFGQVHLFNNYFVGSKSQPAYPYEYSVGVGQQAQILSNNNVFEIAGVTRCDQVVTPIGGTVPGAFKDVGSVLNGAALAGCSTPNNVAYTVPYAYSARPLALVKANAIAQAGAGKLSSTISGSGNVAPDTTVTLTCPASGLYFCDDFQNSSLANWNLLPVAGANGSFSTKAESVGASNIVMQYTAASTGGVLATLKPTAMGNVPAGDYYIEARIKPMTNGTTSNKLLYLLSRYKDASNWYGAGLNVQGATTSTQVEIAKMLNGTLSRPKQVRKPIQMDAQFYTVRFEMIGSTLTVYLDGESQGSVTDTAFAERGLVGLYTTNKSFQIDDVRIGDPSLKPSQLTLNPSALTYSAEVGDTPLAVSVTAVKPSGASDNYNAMSSNPAVAAVAVVGTVLTVTPVGAGNATITVTSESDPTLQRTITATISPQFIQPTQSYALSGAALPAAHADAVHPDATLKLTFDGPPTLGSGGSIRIFRKADNALVDVIRLSGETDVLGYVGQANVRKVNTTPITISGNSVTIKPHANKLAYGTEYYVAIANGVFSGASLGGVPFVGIGALGDWSFTTRTSGPASGATSLTVGDASDTDFSSVQGALNYAMQTLGQADPVTIQLRNGVYNELLYLRGKDNLTLRGETRDGAIIQYTNYDTLNPGTGASQADANAAAGGGRAVLLVEASDLLVLDTLTVRNTTLRLATISAQAETLYFSNDSGRLIARNASFYSEQDTLNLKGYAWFYHALVAGSVDFIWGSSRAALFEESEIRSLGDTGNATSGGYVLQARAANATDKGYVFLNSSLTHGPGPGPLHGDVPAGATYLARSGGSSTYWDNIAFISTKMDGHIAAVGWAAAGVNGQPAPNPATPSAASGWREYGSTTLAGDAINLAARVGGFQLSASDVAAGFADRAKVFAAYGGGAGWNPQP
jgi:pectate lyase